MQSLYPNYTIWRLKHLSGRGRMNKDNPPSPSLSYAEAGVDIDAGNRLVDTIKPVAQSTHREGVLGGLGGFGALFELPLDRYRQPVLVSGTDGVGTKLLLAQQLGRHDTIGIDLVAMCVNDIIVQGAEPLFFLDYFATGALDVASAAQVVQGIGEGCRQAGCALVGGETAEMPGMYAPGHYDLAGFAVGIVDKDRMLDGTAVAAGDVIIGLPSSGPHSNGYSLIRKVLEVSGTPLDLDLDGRPIGESLLTPTRIYVKPLLALLDQVPVHALCHITGGGLPENLPRVFADASLRAVIDTGAWDMPVVFQWLRDTGNIADAELYRTFNCGIGMILCVAETDRDQTLSLLRAAGEQPLVIGQVESGGADERVILTS